MYVESAIRSCATKKVFLKFPQNLGENTNARVSPLINLNPEGSKFSENSHVYEDLIKLVSIRIRNTLLKKIIHEKYLIKIALGNQD